MARRLPSSARERYLGLVVGSTGSGKTSVARALIRRHAPERILVLDRKGDRDSGLACHVADSIFTDHRAMHAALSKLERGDRFTAALVPRFGADAAAAGWLAELAQWIGKNIGPLWLVIEEAGFALPRGTSHPKMREIALDGRHDGISILAGAQRPVYVDPDIRAELMAGETWIGRLAQWNDRNVLKELRGPELADAAGRLEVIPESGFAKWLRLKPSGGDADAWRLRYVSGEPVLEPFGNGSANASAGASMKTRGAHSQKPAVSPVPGRSVVRNQSIEPGASQGASDDRPKRPRR